MPFTEDEILVKVKEFRQDGIAGSSELFDRMRKAEDFVIGNQWDPAVKENNENKGKFCLTIPLVKPQIKQLAGAEVQNPKEIKVGNTRTGTAAVARILTALAKQVTDTNRVKYEKSQTFEAGLGSGQGVLGVFLDKTEDPLHNNIVVKKLVEHNVLFDPNCLIYDINEREGGCKYVIWEDWIDKDLVKEQYPDKKPELDAVSSTGGITGAIFGAVGSVIDWMSGRRSSSNAGDFSGQNREDITRQQKSQYRLNHTWWREPRKCVHWFTKGKSEIESKFLIKPAEIKAAKEATKQFPDAFRIEEVISNVMHHTIRVDDLFLEDRVDELNGVMMFPIVPFWPYFVNGYKSGMSEDLIGTQEEINWSHSMKLNLVKLLANSGYIVNADPTGEYSDWLQDHGGEDGIVLDKNKAGGGIERLDPVPFPVAFGVIEEGAKENLRVISGVRTENPDTDKDRVASAIALKQQASSQGSASLMSNWDYSASMFGDLIIDIIRKNDVFSHDEIREIVDEEDLIDVEFMDQAITIVIQELEAQGVELPEQPIPPDENVLQVAEPVVQQVTINQFSKEQALFEQVQQQVRNMAIPLAQGMLMDSIRSMKAGKYSTNVTVSPMAATIRAVKAAEVFELQKILLEGGDVGLDGEDLIDATDVANKEELKIGRQRKIQQVTQAAGNVSARSA